ncbi:MAG: lipid-A-disaccharide synthase, partial [Elainella sp.]
QQIPGLRISLVLSPCPNASGQEVALAQRYDIDRVQAAKDFWPFLLWGKTAAGWDWAPQGIVVFLGGDQFFTVVIGKRLGYKTLIYGEWETRWHRWIDRFAVMKPSLIGQAPRQYADRFTVVGDLMADVAPPQQSPQPGTPPNAPLIGLLPGSKSAKLAQGLPLALAVAEQVQQSRPQTRFVIPVAPTLDLATLARFADPEQNPVLGRFGQIEAELHQDDLSQDDLSQTELPYLKTASGLRVALWNQFPAHALLARCDFCLTTVGANTAELGALAIPMIVLLPTQQLDAMRAWDGLPGLLANLPGVGTLFAKLINGWLLQHWLIGQNRLLAWPNIWAGRAIVPELVGELQPQQVAQLAIEWLDSPEQLQQVRQALQQVRGEAGAARRLAQIVADWVQEFQTQAH